VVQNQRENWIDVFCIIHSSSKSFQILGSSSEVILTISLLETTIHGGDQHILRLCFDGKVVSLLTLDPIDLSSWLLSLAVLAKCEPKLSIEVPRDLELVIPDEKPFVVEKSLTQEHEEKYRMVPTEKSVRRTCGYLFVGNGERLRFVFCVVVGNILREYSGPHESKELFTWVLKDFKLNLTRSLDHKLQLLVELLSGSSLLIMGESDLDTYDWGVSLSKQHTDMAWPLSHEDILECCAKCSNVPFLPFSTKSASIALASAQALSFEVRGDFIRNSAAPSQTTQRIYLRKVLPWYFHDKIDVKNFRITLEHISSQNELTGHSIGKISPKEPEGCFEILIPCLCPGKSRLRLEYLQRPLFGSPFFINIGEPETCTIQNFCELETNLYQLQVYRRDGTDTCPSSKVWKAPFQVLVLHGRLETIQGEYKSECELTFSCSDISKCSVIIKLDGLNVPGSPYSPGNCSKLEATEPRCEIVQRPGYFLESTRIKNGDSYAIYDSILQLDTLLVPLRAIANKSTNTIYSEWKMLLRNTKQGPSELLDPEFNFLKLLQNAMLKSDLECRYIINEKIQSIFDRL